MPRNTKRTTNSKLKMFTAARIGFYVCTVLTFLFHIPAYVATAGHREPASMGEALGVGLFIWIGTLFAILCAVCFVVALFTDKKRQWPNSVQVLLFSAVIFNAVMAYAGGVDF